MTLDEFVKTASLRGLASMTREEAIAIIKAIGKHAIETHLTDPGDIMDATVMAVEAMVPKPDEVTGLMPCGCGGKAILFHQPDIEGPGSDGDRWAVFCEKTCGMETSELTSREYAVEAWNTGMGYKGGAE